MTKIYDLEEFRLCRCEVFENAMKRYSETVKKHGHFVIVGDITMPSQLDDLAIELLKKRYPEKYNEIFLKEK